MTFYDIDETIPLYKNQLGMYVTAYSKDYLEPLGLLKMDFLGLRTLTVIQDTIDMVKQNRNIDVVFDAKYDDELKGKNVKITSLIVPKDTHMNLEYHAHLIQTEDLSQLVKSVNYYMKVGQKWGMFRYTDSLRSYLMNKYFVD